MNEEAAVCHSCRFCQSRWTPGEVKESWHRYCVLKKTRELIPCPGYETETKNVA
jgi:hypothetical protein